MVTLYEWENGKKMVTLWEENGDTVQRKWKENGDTERKW
jgi:hypothetical protein